MFKKITRAVSTATDYAGVALEHVRSRDEGTKRRYLMAISGIAMVLVVFLWVQYFTDSVIQPASGETKVAEAPERTTGPGILDMLTGGVAAIYRGIANTAIKTIDIL